MSGRWFWGLEVWDWTAPPPKGYHARHGVTTTDLVIDRLEGVRPWKPGTRLVFESSRSDRLEDFPWCVAAVVMSARAVEALWDLLNPDGVFHRATLRRSGRKLDTEYYAYRSVRRFRVLDRSRWDPEEERVRCELYSLGHTMRFKYDTVPPDVHAFRPRESPESLLVSEAVADRLAASDLVGWMLMDPEDPPWRRKALYSKGRPE